MRQVVENSSDGLLVIDEQGKVRSVNPAAERMLGQHAAEIVGQHFFDVIATPSHQPPIHSLSRMAYADRAEPDGADAAGRLDADRRRGPAAACRSSSRTPYSSRSCMTSPR